MAGNTIGGTSICEHVTILPIGYAKRTATISTRIDGYIALKDYRVLGIIRYLIHCGV